MDADRKRRPEAYSTLIGAELARQPRKEPCVASLVLDQRAQRVRKNRAFVARIDKKSTASGIR